MLVLQPTPGFTRLRAAFDLGAAQRGEGFGGFGERVVPGKPDVVERQRGLGQFPRRQRGGDALPSVRVGLQPVGGHRALLLCGLLTQPRQRGIGRQHAGLDLVEPDGVERGRGCGQLGGQLLCQPGHLVGTREAQLARQPLVRRALGLPGLLQGHLFAGLRDLLAQQPGQAPVAGLHHAPPQLCAAVGQLAAGLLVPHSL